MEQELQARARPPSCDTLLTHGMWDASEQQVVWPSVELSEGIGKKGDLLT